jgi:MFS transporter, ACS family, D-galactonate transporter
LISWLVVRYGWRQMFLLVGAVALISLVPWLAFFPDSLNLTPTEHEEHRLPANQTRRPLLTFNRNLLGICIGFFCLDFYAYLLLTWLPDYLVEVRNFTILKAGSLTAIAYLAFGLSEPVGGWIADHFIRAGHDETCIRKAIVGVAFLAGLMMVPATIVKDGKLAMALIAATSLVGLSTANVTVILQSCAPPWQVGAWTGVENFAGNLGGVIAPVLMDVLIVRTGSYIPGFVVACVLLVLGAGAYWFIVGDLNPHGAGRS